MRKYTTTRRPPRMWFDDEFYIPDMRESVTVYTTDSAQVWTGLVDKSGNQILYTDEAGPIGFLAFDESE